MPAANTSCDPVPVPVVNEYEGVQSDVERIARQFAATGQRVTQERDEAIGHLRAVMNAERQAPPHRPQEDDEALAFLARFPVREGDET